MSGRTDHAGGGVAAELPVVMREYACGPSQWLSPDIVVAVIANWLWFAPLELPYDFTAYGITVENGDVAAGNRYIALYNSVAYAPNTRLAVSALTASAGVSRMQYIPFITPVALTAGLYFLALIVNNADTFVSNLHSLAFGRPLDINNGLPWYYQNTGFIVPPVNPVPNQIEQGYTMRLRIAAT